MTRATDTSAAVVLLASEKHAPLSAFQTDDAAQDIERARKRNDVCFVAVTRQVSQTFSKSVRALETALDRFRADLGEAEMAVFAPPNSAKLAFVRDQAAKQLARNLKRASAFEFGGKTFAAVVFDLEHIEKNLSEIALGKLETYPLGSVLVCRVVTAKTKLGSLSNPTESAVVASKGRALKRSALDQWLSLPAETSRADSLRAVLNARKEILSELRGKSLSAADLANLLNSTARGDGVRTIAARFRSSGEALSVKHGRGYLYPEFQFDTSTHSVRPEMSEIIRLFENAGNKIGDGWPLLHWFFAHSGLLGGERPVDVFTSDPKRVLKAAQRQFGHADRLPKSAAS